MLGQVFDFLEPTNSKQLRSELFGVGVDYDNEEAPFDELCSESLQCFDLVSWRWKAVQNLLTKIMCLTFAVTQEQQSLRYTNIEVH